MAENQPKENIQQPAKKKTSRLKVVLIILALLFSLLVLKVILLITAKPKITVNYVAELNHISKPADYDPNDNASPYYQKAFELCVEQPKQLSKSDIKTWPKDLPEDKQTLLQNWVSANSDALEQLKLGTQKPYYWSEYKGDSMWDIAMPPLGKTRSLAYAIRARSKLNAAKGDPKAAFSDLLVCYQFGSHLTGPKTLIEQLVGIATSALAVQTGLEIIDKTRPSTDLLKDFQQQLQVLSSQATFTIDFTGEKFLVYDSIQRMFTDDGKGGGHVYDTRLLENPACLESSLGLELTAEQRESFKMLERQQTTELTDEVFEYFSQQAHKTPWHLHNEGTDIEKTIEETTKDNPLVNMLTPAFARVLHISSRIRVHTDALITTLAILRYKAEKAQLPGNLDQLVSAGYLEELPIDPFSDAPLVYKQIDNDFTLYSLGADFDDDGGARSKWGEGEQGGDQVFWPIE